MVSMMDKQQIPVGYKQTEVGVIPEDWEINELGSLSTFIGSGKTVTNESGEYLLFGSTGVIGTCKSPEYFGDAILVARVGANAGRLNFVTGEYGVSDNTIIVRIRSGLSIGFLKYQLIKKNLNTLVFGSGQPLITGSQLKALLIPVPPKKEQTAIANALSDVDALISALEKFIDKKTAIKTATMQQLLTGKKRLPPFDQLDADYKQTELGVIPKDWEIVTIGDIADVKTGPFGSTLHEKDYVVDGTPIITVEHLGERGVTYKNLPMVSDLDKKRLSSYSLRIGDIAFSRVGSIDRNALIRAKEEGWLFSGRLLRVRLSTSKNVPEYLSYQFHSKPFKQRVVEVAVGQTMPSLNTAILKGIKVILPENKQEQTAIANVLSDMDTELDGLQQRLVKTQQIKQGMMQELLTGKTRLVTV